VGGGVDGANADAGIGAGCATKIKIPPTNHNIPPIIPTIPPTNIIEKAAPRAPTIIIIAPLSVTSNIMAKIMFKRVPIKTRG
jgi:hypothetical protein